VCGCQGPGGRWKLDITIWLHDIGRPHRMEAERMRDATLDQRLAILRLKDRWQPGPRYPDPVGGVDVYRAVLEHGVRTEQQFSAHLRDRGLPADPEVTLPAHPRDGLV
jgi:hypothetical protein